MNPAWPENGPIKKQNLTTFWPGTQTGENVAGGSVCPCLDE